MKAMGIEVSSVGVANLYKDFLNAIVIDEKDSDLKQSLSEIINKVIITNTIMNNNLTSGKIAAGIPCCSL